MDLVPLEVRPAASSCFIRVTLLNSIFDLTATLGGQIRRSSNFAASQRTPFFIKVFEFNLILKMKGPDI